MKTYFHYGTLKKTIIQFLDMFNEIKVAKLNNEEIYEFIKVPLKYAGKQKWYYAENDRKNEVLYPMMGATMTAIAPAINERMVNDFIKIPTVSPSGDDVNSYTIGVPYSIDFDLYITALYNDHIDQILEQIIPYFSPDAFITISVPELNTSFDAKVIIQSCENETDVELSNDENRLIAWNLTFTVHTYFFKPIYNSKTIKSVHIEIDDIDSRKEIETIITN